MRVCAVDWSGKLSGAEDSIWVAEARDGTLIDLRSGLDREQAVSHLIAAARADPDTVVGLDFAFSFPRWWCEERGWRSPSDIWAAMERDGEALLAACEPPFWGRRAKCNPHGRERGYRRTEREVRAGRPKSVFQIGGAGAVGTGSIRGMPHLLALSRAGFSVWPFHQPRSSQVVEIYPRALTGAVRKSSWSARLAYLLTRFRQQPEHLLERAAGSEDAFDAAVSAIMMSRHAEELRALRPSHDPLYAIEGRIWQPTLAAAKSLG